MDFNSINVLKLKYREISKVKYNEWFLYSNVFAVDICLTRFKNCFNCVRISFSQGFEEFWFHKTKETENMQNRHFSIQISILYLNFLIRFFEKVHRKICMVKMSDYFIVLNLFFRYQRWIFITVRPTNYCSW